MVEIVIAEKIKVVRDIWKREGKYYLECPNCGIRNILLTKETGLFYCGGCGKIFQIKEGK